MIGNCEAAKAGAGKEVRTPCGINPSPGTCGKCPFWQGTIEHYASGTRGGESTLDSFRWRRIKWQRGIPGGDN